MGGNNLHGENMSERQTVKCDGGNNLHDENMSERQTVKCDGGEQSSRREHVRASNSQM